MFLIVCDSSVNNAHHDLALARFACRVQLDDKYVFIFL